MRGVRRILGLFVALSLSSFAHAAHPAGLPTGELKLGRWVGYLQVDGNPEAIAATLDTFLNQPSDPKQFPKVRALFKLSLGGYNTSEYDTTIYSDIHYDFHSGLINLDEPGASLAISGYVYVAARVRFEGSVQIPESGVKGKVVLYYQNSSEPDPDDEPAPMSPPLAGTLSGQYVGNCVGRPSVIQIQTARGLLNEGEIPSTGLHSYLIAGRFGSDEFCSKKWCQLRSYQTANYDYFQGNLTLYGSYGAENCTLRQGELICQILETAHPQTCKFQKTAQTAKPFYQAPNRYSNQPTTEQAAPLPDYSVSNGKALLEALDGTFMGYLHHESRDLYQPIRLDIAASTSSENPHIENDIHISAMASEFLGDPSQRVYSNEKFDRRPFYLRPGFVLEADSADSMIEIMDWKSGVIRGNWYSKQFGRVGSFIVTKGKNLPTLSPKAQTTESMQGTFQSDLIGARKVRTVFSTQPTLPNKSYFLFQGDSQIDVDSSYTIRTRIVKGSYDIYSGAMGWLGEAVDPDPSLVFATGVMEPKDGLKLFVPGMDRFGVPIYEFGSTFYKRISQ